MTQQTTIPVSNYTMLPNVYLDLIPEMKEPEMKVMGVAIRYTIGYHNYEPKPMSQTWLMAKTGLSKNAVKKGIAEAIKRGWMKQTKEATRTTAAEYVLVFDDKGVSRNDTQNAVGGSRNDSPSGSRNDTIKRKQDKETLDVSSDTSQRENLAVKKTAPLKEKKSTTPREIINPMKDAIVTAFKWNWQTMTKNEISLVCAAAKQLCEARYTPADVQAIYKYCVSQNWTGGFTPMALTTHAQAGKATITSRATTPPTLPVVPISPDAPAAQPPNIFMAFLKARVDAQAQGNDLTFEDWKTQQTGISA